MPEGLALVLLLLAALPAGLSLANLFHFRRLPPRRDAASRPRASVLVPARNEEQSIAAAVESVRSSRDAEVEIHVMDDGSEDGTAQIVRSLAAKDARIRLHQAPPPAPGWCGKQHACHLLSRVAKTDTLLFMDADVTLSPDAVGRIVSFLESSGSALVSGFPRQQTGSFLERLLIPLIHFVLLGFLPIMKMRRSSHPAYAAGCGQLVAVRREAYERVGGHGAIRSCRHDGLQLPRAFRRAGLRIDLFDATDLARCRMYRGAREVWNGLAKNATEGMAAPAAIVPWTVLLVGGQVLPPALLVAGWAAGASAAFLALVGAATILGFVTRALLARRFEQSWLAVALHPVGVLLLIAVQWYALLRESLGRPVAWKGRHA